MNNFQFLILQLIYFFSELLIVFSILSFLLYLKFNETIGAIFIILVGFSFLYLFTKKNYFYGERTKLFYRKIFIKIFYRLLMDLEKLKFLIKKIISQIDTKKKYKKIYKYIS